MINIHKMMPPVALVTEFSRVIAAYKLTRRKIVLFLPLHYLFKRMAWFFGFLSNIYHKR